MFAVDGDSLVSVAAFDFESMTSHTIRVRSTDQGDLYVEKVFTIDVVDLNIALSNNTLPENRADGHHSSVPLRPAGLSGSTFSYALVSGEGSTDNAYFVIAGNTLKTATVFDYESANSYSVRVRSTNEDGLYAEQVFVVNVTNVNEAPFGYSSIQ